MMANRYRRNLSGGELSASRFVAEDDQLSFRVGRKVGGLTKLREAGAAGESGQHGRMCIAAPCCLSGAATAGLGGHLLVHDNGRRLVRHS